MRYHGQNPLRPCNRDRWMGLDTMKSTGLLAGLFTACLIVMAVIAIFQDRFIYFPENASIETLTAGGLRAWPTTETFRGLVGEPSGTPRGTAIVFHGNAGHAGH